MRVVMGKIDHSGHRQRMKERFLHEGIDKFSDYQVLELLLFFGVPYKDTNGLAHTLLDRYGTLSGVLNADYYELKEIKEMGAHASLLVSLIPALAQRYSRDRWRGKPQIANTNDAGMYSASLFVNEVYEAFYMICLDSQNRVVMPVRMSKGTINEAMIYPRLIVENALRHKAAMVILAHNHPGGSTDPSSADIEITKKLAAALAVITVGVMDHIIVAGENFLSFADKRLI